jgi:hypothetical protein
MSTVADVRIWTISKPVQRSQGINTQGESAESSARGCMKDKVQGLSKVCTEGCIGEDSRD